jgi:hypothetical protein
METPHPPGILAMAIGARLLENLVMVDYDLGSIETLASFFLVPGTIPLAESRSIFKSLQKVVAINIVFIHPYGTLQSNCQARAQRACRPQTPAILRG